MEPFGVYFRFDDRERFLAARRVFERIKSCKETGDWPADVDGWREFFDQRSLDHFWWPTASEFEAFKKLYFTIPVDERHKDPRLQHPWDFMSMFEAFKDGDYALEDFDEDGEGMGCLIFDPHGHPYGGTGCMRAFIEAFDMEVTDVNE